MSDNSFEYIELVPQAVIDAGNNLIRGNTFNTDMHRHRLEVIRDYCDAVLKNTDKTKVFRENNRKNTR
jgi:methionine synthase I (cobalamin-dependent)